MLTTNDENRLVTLTFRVTRMAQLMSPSVGADADMKLRLLMSWVIDDWQRELRILENKREANACECFVCRRQNG